MLEQLQLNTSNPAWKLIELPRIRDQRGNLTFIENNGHNCKTRFAFGVDNGLDALVIALKALEIKSGDEVIVPAHTFIATWLAVSAVGAVPVPVEVCKNTFNINPEQIKSAINKKTKAIIGVHLYGRPFEAKKLQDICQQNNLYLIEDAA
jgi:dTDP-3-amino-3,4,6-trideoxy-alpha-D-glucose transaminase